MSSAKDFVSNMKTVSAELRDVDKIADEMQAVMQNEQEITQNVQQIS